MMTAELTTVVGQLRIKAGKWHSKASNQVAVREPKTEDVPGVGKGDLFIVTEIQGNVANRDALEQQLAHTIRDAYYLSRGSITASLRRTIQAGSDLIQHYNQQMSSQERLVGGAVALVTSHEDAFVAQIGPAAFFAVLGDHIRRYPARSAWLDEPPEPVPDEEAALGLYDVVEPNLHHLRLGPEDKLVLADSRLASRLPLKELVYAVDAGNVKTAIKNLAKVARDQNCSAIVLEVVETKSATIGPLKIATLPQLSGFLTREPHHDPRHHHSRPANQQTVEAQPVAAQTVAETTIAPPLLEPAAQVATHSSVEASPLAEAHSPAEVDSRAVFSSTSIMQKPFQWLDTLTHKPQPKAPAAEQGPQNKNASYYQPTKDDNVMSEITEHSKVLDSLAPESTFRSALSEDRPNSAGLTIKKIFRGLGMGLLMLVVLLGSGLKTILNLILPGTGGHQTPRQAGTQAHRQSPSASSWVLLRNVAIAIPILVTLIVTVNYLQKGRIREAEYNEFITTAQQKFEQAQAVDTDAALGLMTEAETVLVQAEQIKENQPEISTLRQQMAEEADKIGNVHRLYYLPQLRQYTDAGTNLSSIIVQGVEVYVMDAGNDRIYHHQLDDLGEALLADDEAAVVTVSRGQVVENITVDDLLDMTWMPTGGNRQTSDLMILNSTGLLEYNPNWGTTTSALAGGESLVLPAAVDSYFGNFYLLDPQANVLLRYLPTLDGYSTPPESYFPTDLPVDLSQAVDLAIDGSIYVLFREGHISQYLGGQPVLDFKVTGLDISFSNPVSIFTAPDEEVQYLYVADAGNRRVVQLNKDGSFVRQFKPRTGEAISFANLQDIFVDEIGGRMYILDSNNLYLTNIPTIE
jgi:hypothetical protein